MTQVDPRSAPEDALAAPFTPGMAENDPALATFTDSVAAPVDIQLSDPRTAEFVAQAYASWNGIRQGVLWRAYRDRATVAPAGPDGARRALEGITSRRHLRDLRLP